MEEEFDGVASKGPVQTKALTPGIKLVKDIKCLVNTRMPAWAALQGSMVTSYLGVRETTCYLGVLPLRRGSPVSWGEKLLVSG